MVSSKRLNFIGQPHFSAGKTVQTIVTECESKPAARRRLVNVGVIGSFVCQRAHKVRTVDTRITERNGDEGQPRVRSSRRHTTLVATVSHNFNSRRIHCKSRQNGPIPCAPRPVGRPRRFQRCLLFCFTRQEQQGRQQHCSRFQHRDNDFAVRCCCCCCCFHHHDGHAHGQDQGRPERKGRAIEPGRLQERLLPWVRRRGCAPSRVLSHCRFEVRSKHQVDFEMFRSPDSKGA